jgi:hypothetical protein
MAADPDCLTCDDNGAAEAALKQWTHLPAHIATTLRDVVMLLAAWPPGNGQRGGGPSLLPRTVTAAKEHVVWVLRDVMAGNGLCTLDDLFPLVAPAAPGGGSPVLALLMMAPPLDGVGMTPRRRCEHRRRALAVDNCLLTLIGDLLQVPPAPLPHASPSPAPLAS